MPRKLTITAILLAVAFVALLGFNRLPSTRVRAQLNLGQKYLEEMQYEDALLAFQSAIDIDEKSVPAYLGVVDVYLGMVEKVSAEENASADDQTQKIEEYLDEAEKAVAQAEEIMAEEYPDDNETAVQVEERKEKVKEKKKAHWNERSAKKPAEEVEDEKAEQEERIGAVLEEEIPPEVVSRLTNLEEFNFRGRQYMGNTIHEDGSEALEWFVEKVGSYEVSFDKDNRIIKWEGESEMLLGEDFPLSRYYLKEVMAWSLSEEKYQGNPVVDVPFLFANSEYVKKGIVQEMEFIDKGNGESWRILFSLDENNRLSEMTESFTIAGEEDQGAQIYHFQYEGDNELLTECSYTDRNGDSVRLSYSYEDSRLSSIQGVAEGEYGQDYNIEIVYDTDGNTTEMKYLSGEKYSLEYKGDVLSSCVWHGSYALYQQGISYKFSDTKHLIEMTDWRYRTGDHEYVYSFKYRDIEKNNEEGANEYADSEGVTDTAEQVSASSLPNIEYSVHVQDIGWMDSVKNGAAAGDEGSGLRIEAITIEVLDAPNLGVQYRSHVQIDNWETEWLANGQVSGTTGEEKRLEALQIVLTGIDADKYDIYYCVQTAKNGWMAWAKNGESSGTEGYKEAIEAIRVELREKGTAAPINLGNTVDVFLVNPNPD